MKGPTEPAGLGFALNGLGRSAVEKDPETIRRQALGPGGLAIVIAGDLVVLDEAGDGRTALLQDAGHRFGEPDEFAVLGVWGEAPVSARLYGAALADTLAHEPAIRTVDLRTIAAEALVPDAELGALAQAKALLGWHARHRFCAQCGAPTASACAGLRRDCAGCGAQHFPRTDPVAIMLVEREGRCLLGRQSRFVAGSYSCLAGFVSPGETVEEAVRREVMEEAGITVGAVEYWASQPWPFPSSLMIGCRAEALDDAIRIDRDELEDARWFSRDEVRLMMERRHPGGLVTPPPLAIAHHLIRRWADEG